MNASTPHLPQGCGRVREEPILSLPGLVHPGWAVEFPWLVQGTTRRGPPGDPFDLGLFAHAAPAGAVMGAWARLGSVSGCPRVVLARQVHGAGVRVHGAGAPGLGVAAPCDGHATGEAGLLLAVTVADCVPVFLMDPQRRAVALLHAGWKGAAAGILERGLEVLASRLGSRAGDVRVHLGPAICGACYEVGPEVFGALGLAPPEAPAHLDLRAALAMRACAEGVDPRHVTVSEHCTRCTGSGLFSHRGGDGGRQAGFLGIRA